MLQKGFLQHHQAGILPGCPDCLDRAHALPSDVVRGAMLLRCNSLIRGHSAVRMEVIHVLVQALTHRITPIIPLRGSISASGDLSPLSYIGGLLEGNPDIFVQVNAGEAENPESQPKILPASEALHQAGITPITLRAKEALGVMNGTAPSSAAAALVLWDTHTLAILAQILTAMATESLLGSVDNYHDFISQCRPHPGQTETANNIRSFLSASKLAQEMDVKQQGLVQDRYALRTAPQWIGPLLEDLLLATQQVNIELNSTTDNPLIDVASDRFHHGGNFQAACISTAMEKTKTVLAMLGRLIASQCQEVINPFLNKGLTPNLCFDDPSTSFTCKGIDINMSSYLSELAFLGNSVVSNVQVAEMGNQSINSLALIAARYTKQAVDIVGMMCAAHLYVLCQALDLRALDQDFFATAQSELCSIHDRIFRGQTAVASDFERVWEGITAAWHAHSQSDLNVRYKQVAKDSAHQLFDDISPSHSGHSEVSICEIVQQWKTGVECALVEVHQRTRRQFSAHQSTPAYLARATKEIYLWVRQILQVPLHRGIIDHPDALSEDGAEKTIGTHITKIYMGIQSGEVIMPLQRATRKGA